MAEEKKQKSGAAGDVADIRAATSNTDTVAAESASTTPKSIAVIDGNSLMHRAYHAIPQNMMSPQGIHTNAVYGFLSMFIRMVQDFHPWGVIVCFDKGKPSVRMEMYPGYKAQRPPQDPELHEQFPLAKELLAALAVPVVELEGWEGDDLLGTLAKQGAEQGFRMLLVTGDKDMYQLSSKNVAIISTKRGMSNVTIMTPEAVQDLYGGITPDLVPDFYGLKGDKSDNIPGVPGVGPKKAQQLIGEFGSLEGVLAHAEEIPGKMGENIRNHADAARLSRQVAIIRTDAPLEVDFDEARFPEFDKSTAREAFVRLGFTTIAQRLFRACNVDDLDALKRTVDANGARGGEIEGGFKWREGKDAPSKTKVSDAKNADEVTSPSGRFELPPILEDTAAEAALEEATKSALWLGVSIAESEDVGTLFDEGKTLWVSTPQGLIARTGDAAQMTLLDLFEHHRIASCNIKELIHELYPTNLSEPARLDMASLDPNRIFDVSVGAYLLKSSQDAYTANDLVLQYLNVQVTEEDLNAQRAKESDAQTMLNAEKTAPAQSASFASRPTQLAAQVAATVARLIRPLIKEQLDRTGSNTCFDLIEMPLAPVLCQIERIGMQATEDVFVKQAADLSHSIHARATSIFKEAGEEFNIDSPAQLSRVLFDVMGLPTDGLKKTKKGFYSTNAQVLETLSHEYEIVQNVLHYREENKILNTYLVALPAYIKSDGRIHTTLNQTITTTGRLSSSDPNLQNIPTRSELGHRVRKAFTVPADSVFLACDYSQIELRLLAHLSGDENLIQAFKEGEDFHAETASRVFGVPIAEITPDLRSRAKAVNFGIVYGQQAFGLSQTLGIPNREAQQMIDAYFEAYPAVRRFLDETVQETVENGFVTTMYNRRRLIPDITSINRLARFAAERMAMNHPMQGSAADIIKLSMIQVAQALREGGFKARMILQIHDELDFQVPKSELKDVAALVKDKMEHVVELSVPLVVEVSHGGNWADAK